MFRKSRAQNILDSAWLQIGLLLLGGIFLWWFRRRGQKSQQVEDRPVVWRRDIEMGPTAPIPTTPIIQEEDDARDAAASGENIPQVRAGGGWLEPEGTGAAGQAAGDVNTIPETGPAAVTGPVPSVEEAEDETPGGDDLTIIEGIGPKINVVLQEAGIRTFRKLARTSEDKLRQILQDAGLRTTISNPETWAEQAKVAAEGDWEGLSTLQKNIKNGRRT